MAEIARFIPANNRFDPEMIRILRAAYDRATAELHDHGHAKVVREIIGKRIVALAAKGERDPERLCDFGLVAAGLQRRSL